MDASPVRKLTTGPKLAEQAYEALRSDITSGTFAPGQRVTERALAARLGVSPTPIREAISRLEHERLLEREGRILTVAAPGTDRRRELVRIEAVLRGVAARIAAARASDRELTEIARLHAQAQRVTKRGRSYGAVAEQALTLTRAFHAKIDEAAHNPMLTDMIATATAFDWAVRVDALRTLGDYYPAQEAHREHGEIVEALRARDAELAEQLVVTHTLRTGDQFLSYLEHENDEARA